MARATHDKELKEAIDKKNWKDLVTTCENYELDAAELYSLDANTTPHYGVQLLAYLLNNDVCNARFLWKRIPSEIKKSQKEFGSIWNIGKSMYKGDLPAVYKAISAGGFSGNHKDLVSELEKVFRNRVLFLLSSGYSSISSKDASSAFGLDEKKTAEFVTSHGWTKSGNHFKPKAPLSNKTQNVDLVQLQQLTDYFCYLSSKN